jgi:hypothetical protein
VFLSELNHLRFKTYIVTFLSLKSCVLDLSNTKSLRVTICVVTQVVNDVTEKATASIFKIEFYLYVPILD